MAHTNRTNNTLANDVIGTCIVIVTDISSSRLDQSVANSSPRTVYTVVDVVNVVFN